MLTFAAAVFLLIACQARRAVDGWHGAAGWRRGCSLSPVCVPERSGQPAVISGLAAVILAEPVVRTVLLFASSAYLGYLALRIALAGATIAFIRTAAPGFTAGVTLQFINPKAYAVNTALFSSFAFYPESFAVETALKLVIVNLIWVPLHLAWLYAGVKINSLNLPPRTQRAINLVMAGCLIAVVILSVWSVAGLPASNS